MQNNSPKQTTRKSQNSHSGKSKGSVLVTFTLTLGLIAVVLGASELGYLFFMKREYQKAVDLAALAGAQKIVPGYSCSKATSAASATAAANASGISQALAITCGNWNSATNTADSRHFVANGSNFNAIRASINQSPGSLLPAIFTGNRIIHVEAIATIGQPSAAFSVGTQLARINGDSTVGRALKGLGIPISGSLAAYDSGLLSASITPGGLLKELGIEVPLDISAGDLNNLLAASANAKALIDVLNATVRLADQDSLLNLNTSLVDSLRIALPTSPLNLQLGTNSSSARGLFASIISPDGTANSALTTQINALDIITTAISVASGNHAISVNGLSVNLGLASATTQAHVIEPAQIAIGGAGAKAYTAQIRSYTRIRAGTSSIPLIGSLLNVNLDIPIVLDVVSGKGTLDRLCETDLQDTAGNNRAKIDVEAAILKSCVGNIDESSVFSNKSICEGVSDKKLLSVAVAGVDMLSLSTHFNIDALPANGSVTLKEGETQTVGNNLLLGTTVNDVTDALLSSLIAGALNSEHGTTYTAVERNNIASDLWGTTACATGNQAGQTCRINRITTINKKIDDASLGLGGFFGSLSNSTLSLVSNVLTVNVGGVLSSISSLTSNLIKTVDAILGGLLDLATGNKCTGGGLLNIAGYGNDNECKMKIADSLAGTAGSGSNSEPNAALALVGFLLGILNPIFDQLGTQIIKPLIESALGVHLGQTDVNMMSLRCETGKLVY